MFIEKYSVQIKDIYSKNSKKITVDANTPDEAHLKALSYCNQLNQDITKITDYSKNVVYTLDDGFKYE